MQPVFGDLLREWRQRRHLSQLELSSRTGVSSRHLSYLETGRSSPSRQMILYLAEHLDIPLRERNALLLAAEYAPVYSHRALDDNGSDMRYVREAIERLLASHGPYPAFVIDRHWDVVARNSEHRRCCWTASTRSCSTRLSTPCAWPCIRPGWHPGSSIWLSGAPTCCGASIIRSWPARIPQ